MKYITDLESYRFDPEKNEYRTQEEIINLESISLAKSKEMSNDFIDELKVKGIVTYDDFADKVELLRDILLKYQEKFFEWLKKQ